MAMKIMSRYIGKTVLSSIGLVTLVLVGLEMFILFVAELNDFGVGNYTLSEVFPYILMQMPYQIYLFFPVATLLGCLIGLGSLASSSELIAIRAAGATVFQLAMATMRAAMILIVLVTLVGETMMHQWVHASAERKSILRSSNQASYLYHGDVWLRSGDNFIYVTNILPEYRLQKVQQYQFNKNHQLVLSRYMQDLWYSEGKWWMSGVKESRLFSNHIKTKKIAQAHNWDVVLSPDLLALVNIESSEMSLKELTEYIHIAHKEHLSAERYDLDYWQRWFKPFVSCIMVFLAIPFIFGPLRQSSMGTRIVLGTALGFGFHIVNTLFGSVSIVYRLPPIIGAAAPMVIFGILAFFLMRRVK